MGERSVREAREQDLPALCGILEQVADDDAAGAPREPTEKERGAFASIQASTTLKLLVVEDAGKVVGTAMFVLVPGIGGGGRPRAVLESVGVDRAARGRGCGEFLIRHCIALARSLDVRKLALTCNHRRGAAHRFYERLGFGHTSRGYTMPL
jgi:ribosomal protein S18 acetylase RimI-like enzyme